MAPQFKSGQDLYDRLLRAANDVGRGNTRGPVILFTANEWTCIDHCLVCMGEIFGRCQERTERNRRGEQREVMSE